jgi:hypothetical protein
MCERKKGLILFIGESFRLGDQGTRNIGHINSYKEQMNACLSHVRFIEKVSKSYNISVHVSTYTTRFVGELINVYKKYLIGSNVYGSLIGLNGLFHRATGRIKNINQYDFVLYIRIDLFLKEHFDTVFDPTRNVILFPTICMIPYHKCGTLPRVNDMLLFVPKKYYKYLGKIIIGHETWHQITKSGALTSNDLDTMIHTYHDSDSAKDYNPLYYIVNRGQSDCWHSEGYTFDKLKFN